MQNALLIRVATFSLIASAAQAGSHLEDAPDKSGKPIAGPFDAGQHELQIGTGVFISFQNTSEHRPQINDAGGHVRLGWMLSSPSGEGFWRGNTEFLVTAYGAGIFKGPGSVLAGGSLLLRRNFVQPGSRWVPYGQLEAGALYSDAYLDKPQRALGEAFEFQLGGGFGVRFLWSDRCTLFGEFNYRHISNAGIADRNVGTNAGGVILGLSWFY